MITLIMTDHKPPSVNEIWAGAHWGRRQRLKAAALLAVRVAMSDAGLVPGDAVGGHVDVVVTCEAVRPYDADNVLIKPYIDALVTYGVLPDDTPAHVRSVTLISRRASADTLTIELRGVRSTVSGRKKPSRLPAQYHGGRSPPDIVVRPINTGLTMLE